MVVVTVVIVVVSVAPVEMEVVLFNDGGVVFLWQLWRRW